MRRRDLFPGIGMALATACVQRLPPGRTTTSRSDPGSLEEIEASLGGRVGVFAFDTGTGIHIAHRADERFAMCSTFKWALVAAVLARIDREEFSLDDRMRFNEADLLECAPVARAHVSEGSMTVEAIAEAAITKSDNTAANLLLTRVDGPLGLTRFFRLLGDPITRLDRNEEALNTNILGDVRDSTSPRAMANLMNLVLCGDVLSCSSRNRLIGWLNACETGLGRLRAGLPTDWTIGDKTGTGLEGAVNDVAIAVPPERAPILIAAYLSDSHSSLSSLSAAHATIGRIVAAHLLKGETHSLSVQPRR